MIKTLNNILKQDKEILKIPKTILDCIPIEEIYDDGIFLLSKNKYSKSYKFLDINYAIASKEDKEEMFFGYSDLLNSLDTGATTKITINNRRIDKYDFEDKLLLKEENDKLSKYREEYNNNLISQSKNASGMIQEKIITVSVYKNSIEEARNYFSRIGVELSNHFSKLGSKCVELTSKERAKILHDFYEEGKNDDFFYFNNNCESVKYAVCPRSIEYKKDYFKYGKKYGRVLYLKEYASYIKDSMITELTDINKNMMLSIDIIPIPMDEAIKEAENRRLGIETNITNWQRKQNANNNWSSVIPYDMEQQRNESKEFLDDLIKRDQRMFLSVLTIAITDDSKEKLENDTENIMQVARKNMCQLGILKYQQFDGLNTVLPIGLRKIDALRTLTTESLAVLMPFKVQEIKHENGIFYGQNAISKNVIVANRKQLLNGNSFILGVSGSGKSFMAKQEIVALKLKDPNADIIIIDPEMEYSPLVKALGGEVIKLSSTSKNHINAMDMNSKYGDGANPIILKSEFILSLCEQLIGRGNLGAKEKSIIDRCTANVYRDFSQRNYTGKVSTLKNFREELLKQNEPEAKEIALAIELFTNGSLDTFANQTNVDISNNLICYDILNLGKQLKPIGMLVVLDSILNRITANRRKGRNTYIFIDEIYLLFQYEYTANFLYTLWKRVRKYGAFCTGITQNIEDLLQSLTARTMLSNSEFIIMLNQASNDKKELDELLNISELQKNYITNVGAGEGLIKIGSNIIPFVNRFPKNTKLYELMNTKFEENKQNNDY